MKIQAFLSEGFENTAVREIKKAESVYLMNHISCPGILVECGFLSNPTEAALLQQSSHQTKLSAVMGCAILQFITEGETPNEV